MQRRGDRDLDRRAWSRHALCLSLIHIYRNHSMRDSRLQEPWQFGPAALAAIRGAIQTRYRLLPYLYQCFFAHWRDGDPVIRPLLYHYLSLIHI